MSGAVSRGFYDTDTVGVGGLPGAFGDALGDGFSGGSSGAAVLHVALGAMPRVEALGAMRALGDRLEHGGVVTFHSSLCRFAVLARGAEYHAEERGAGRLGLGLLHGFGQELGDGADRVGAGAVERFLRPGLPEALAFLAALLDLFLAFALGLRGFVFGGVGFAVIFEFASRCFPSSS